MVQRGAVLVLCGVVCCSVASCAAVWCGGAGFHGSKRKPSCVCEGLVDQMRGFGLRACILVLFYLLSVLVTLHMRERSSI